MAIKQVIVIRKDLKMRRGKEVAAGAHASMKVFLDRGRFINYYLDFAISLTPEMKEWVEGIFTKITCYVESEKELQELYDKAVVANIPCAIITDVGLTEFNNVPTKTAIAIGPDQAEKIDVITGHLKLY